MHQIAQIEFENSFFFSASEGASPSDTQIVSSVVKDLYDNLAKGHAFLCEPISVTLHSLQGFASFWVWWSYIYYYTPHTHKSIHFLKGNCPRNPNMPSEKA